MNDEKIKEGIYCFETQYDLEHFISNVEWDTGMIGEVCEVKEWMLHKWRWYKSVDESFCVRLVKSETTNKYHFKFDILKYYKSICIVNTYKPNAMIVELI